MEYERCDEETTQPGVYKGLPKLHQLSSANDYDGLATIQTMKLNVKDLESKIESPTPEKPESRRKGTVVSSLARNLLRDNFQDKIAADHLSDESDEDDFSLSGNQSSGSISLDGHIHSLSKFSKDKSNELPEKCETLLNLFNRMESSIRLLRLRNKMPTFKNISTQVEVLTKRKFLCSHLAQMKYLFPNAIQIKKMLLHDEKSLCMYPDMEITLLMDVVERRSPDQSPSMALCEAFRSTLLSFLGSHPEDIEIPEAMLPEPFNLREQKLLLKTSPNGSSAELLPQSFTETELSNASHFPQSFQKLMSRKIIAEGNERTQLLADPSALNTLCTDGPQEVKRSPHKQDEDSSLSAMDDITSSPNRHMISFHQESTPIKTVSYSQLMAETPAQQTPKRPLPTPVEKFGTETEEGSEARLTSSARRSLMYSPSKIEGSMCDPGANMTKSKQDGAIHSEKYQVTPKERGLSGEESSLITNSLMGKDTAICSAGPEEKLGSLPFTFDAVCIISQSTNSSLITKHELVHKILANNLEIEDQREVEEQLSILEELLPDWISKKVVPGGEILYRINHISDQKSVRARLVEAI